MDHRFRPGVPLKAEAFRVNQEGQRWRVVGPYGDSDVFDNKGDAEDYAGGLKKDFDREKADHEAEAPGLGAADPLPGTHADAFGVVGFGQGAGFGTLDRSGQIDPKFHATRDAAERYAASARAAHAKQVADLQAVAARRNPSPSPGRPAPSASSPTANPSTPIGPGVASSGATGMGAGGPRLGPLADSLSKAADALRGVASASRGIPLSNAPQKPAPPAPTASAARRAIDSLSTAMAPAFGQSGDFKGFADAIKGFRESFARGFGPASVNPGRAPAGPLQPGGYPGNRATTQTPPPAASSAWFSGPTGPGNGGSGGRKRAASPSFPDTYDLGTPGEGNVQATPGIFHSFGQAIASQFRKAVSGAQGFSPSAGWQSARGFASNFGHAFGNPAGGIPVGAGGWAGSAASRAATGLGNFGSAAGSVARRTGAGVMAGFQASQAGAGASGIARAFAAGAGMSAPVGAALSAFAGVAGVVVGAAAAFTDLVQRMRAFGDSVVEGNRGLARYNTAIGAAYIGLGIGDFRREIHFGRATQGTAITAVRAVDSMRDDWQGVDILRANTTNRAAGFASSFAGAVGADASRVATVVDARLNEVDPNGWVSAGAGAGLWGGIKGGAQSFYNSFLNDPLGMLMSPGLAGGRAASAGSAGARAAAAAAEAKVVELAAGVAVGNPYGMLLNTWARGGPLTKRPAPRR